MRYLHTMLRVRNLDAALDFYVNKLGLKEVRRYDDQKGRYTNVFLGAPDDDALVADTQAKYGNRARKLMYLATSRALPPPRPIMTSTRGGRF